MVTAAVSFAPAALLWACCLPGLLGESPLGDGRAWWGACGGVAGMAFDITSLCQSGSEGSRAGAVVAYRCLSFGSLLVWLALAAGLAARPCCNRRDGPATAYNSRYYTQCRAERMPSQKPRRRDTPRVGRGFRRAACAGRLINSRAWALALQRRGYGQDHRVVLLRRWIEAGGAQALPAS